MYGDLKRQILVDQLMILVRFEKQQPQKHPDSIRIIDYEVHQISVLMIEGDSNQILDTIDNSYDFIFSCPPYFDLEKYDDDRG